MLRNGAGKTHRMVSSMMEQLSMFDYKETMSPLASRLRPESLETFVGQKHLLGKGKLLRQLIDQDQIPSMIFWGLPASGRPPWPVSLPKSTNADFVNFSAVTSGIKEIKEVMARAELSRRSGLVDSGICGRDPPLQ